MTTIPGLSTTLTSVDRAADLFEVSDTSDGGNSKKTSINYMLNITSQPLELTAVQSPTNKVFDNTNTITVKDTLFTLQDDGDTSKQAKFQLSGITTATTRTYTLPNASSTLVDLTSSQTLSGKVLTAPTINTATIVNPTITVDTISEYTSANGVIIDGVLLKDSKMNGSYITDSSVPAVALATNAITIGYAQITASFVTIATSATLVTGLTAAVTIPSGSRRVEITVYFFNTANSGANVDVLTLWDGAVGAGTQLQQFNSTVSTAQNGATMVWVSNVAPVAGAKTYNVGAQVTAGTGTFSASATAPAFILVKVI